MARETRIGIVLMMLLVGVFGVLAYRRWNSERPTLLADAQTFKDELVAGDPDAAGSGEEREPSTANAPDEEFQPTLAPPREPETSMNADGSESPFGSSADSPDSLPAGASVPIDSGPAAGGGPNPFAGGQSEAVAEPPAAPAEPAGNPFGAMDDDTQPAPEAMAPEDGEDAPGGGDQLAEAPAAPVEEAGSAKIEPPATSEVLEPASEEHAESASDEHGGAASETGEAEETGETGGVVETAPAAAEASPFAAMDSAPAAPAGSGEVPAEGASPVPELAETDADPFGSVRVPPASESTAGAGDDDAKESAPGESSLDEPGSAGATGEESPFPDEAADPSAAPTSDGAAVTLSDDPFGTSEAEAGPNDNSEGGADSGEDNAAVALDEDPFGTAGGGEDATTPEPPNSSAAETPPSETPPTGMPPGGARPPETPFPGTPSTATPAEGVPPAFAGGAGNDAPAAGTTARESGGGASEGRAYVVRERDNYWSISQEVYGSPIYAHALAQHNASVAADPRRLPPGTTLETPPVEELKQRYQALIATGTRAAARSQQRSGYFLTETGQPAYRVSKSETLEEISEAHLGRSSRWVQIYEMNRDVLKKPKALSPGIVLRLPVDASRARVVPRGGRSAVGGRQ